jgi:hypothetical protein
MELLDPALLELTELFDALEPEAEEAARQLRAAGIIFCIP